jgi:hypothetical protein
MVVCLSLRFWRRQKKIPAAIATMSASPPMTPPTIGPAGVGLLGCKVGAEAELEAECDVVSVDDAGVL